MALGELALSDIVVGVPDSRLKFMVTLTLQPHAKALPYGSVILVASTPISHQSKLMHVA